VSDCGTKNVERLIEEGMTAQRNGAFRDALTIYDKVLAIVPNQSDVYFLKSLVCLDLDRINDCLGGLDKAISLAPDVLDYRLVRSEILSQISGREMDAQGDLEVALQIAPKDPRVSAAWGKQCMLEDRLDDAEKYLKKGAILSPDNDLNAQLLADLALLKTERFVAGETADGWASLEKWLLEIEGLANHHEKTQTAKAFLLIAWAERTMGDDIGEAIRKAERALKLPMPDDLRARCQNILEEKRTQRRNLKRSASERWVSAQEKWSLDEPQEAVEQKIVETVERRRLGLARPDEDELQKRTALETQEKFGGDEAKAKYHYAFHPYLGYVQRPYVSGLSYFNNHGFSMRRPWLDYPYNGENGEDYIVGLFGGSVAEQFFSTMRVDLEAFFQERLGGTGRKVTVLNFSQGGFAQPQALLAFQYFQAIGQKFHAVINIDGFNEAMGKRANQINGFHVSLPLSWMMNNLMLQFQTPSDDPEVLAFSGRLLSVQAKVARLERKKEGVFRDWKLKRAKDELERLRSSTPVIGEDRLKEPIVLPRTEKVDARVFAASPKAAEALVSETVQLWAKSSLLLGRSCNAQGIPYLHCLQPNQYFWKKPLSIEEEERYYNHGSAEYFAVQQTYPAMQRHGEELAQQGIDFLDLTGCFDDQTETLLIDSSCHFNKTGYALMADAMKQHLTKIAEKMLVV